MGKAPVALHAYFLTVRKFAGILCFSCASFAAASPDWRVSSNATLSQSYVILHPVSDSVGEVDFHPNNGGQPGIEVRYRGYGFSMTPALTGESQFRSDRPPTRFSDYKVFYYGRDWGVDGYYQRFRGYYGEYGQGGGTDHPSMTLNTFLLNLYRPVYSRYYPMIRDFPQPLLGSEPGGGVADLMGGIGGQGFHVNAFYMISGFRFALESDKPLLDPGMAPASVFGGMTRLNALGMSASFGVNGGVAWRGLFASHTLLLGMGMHQSQSNISAAEGLNPNVKIGGKSYGGYRFGRYSAGVVVHGDVTIVSVSEEETASYTLGLVKLFAEVSF